MSNECMNYPVSAEEFIKSYSFKDSKEIYTNGSLLVPLFRVEQMLEYYFNHDDYLKVVEENKQLKEKLNELLKLFEDTCKNIRESRVDDDVCGLCEFDSGFTGESGDYFTECPGFDKDDCFCLKKELINKFS